MSHRVEIGRSRVLWSLLVLVHVLSALVVVNLLNDPILKLPLLIFIFIHGVFSAKRCGYFNGPKSVTCLQELEGGNWKLGREGGGHHSIGRVLWYFSATRLLILRFSADRRETLVLTSEGQGSETLRRLRLRLID
ncbi:MAG: hypothetical protein QF586_02105 [Arenicellales bacterium]|jgi:hypothetical protein|nr:hypothetical protein [Arenicellales bacterium]MDP7155515.1 hypothetical protein [Arenicellales bacterium]MDP7282958.1 hypothetical protein [Arenicellales bacterium]MDP7481773.1 hypothetical protein [Arenicellales bacterium]MEE1539723.1 hypothetical protein [Arenicellales bacterium]